MSGSIHSGLSLRYGFPPSREPTVFNGHNGKMEFQMEDSFATLLNDEFYIRTTAWMFPRCENSQMDYDPAWTGDFSPQSSPTLAVDSIRKNDTGQWNSRVRGNFLGIPLWESFAMTAGTRLRGNDGDPRFFTTIPRSVMDSRLRECRGCGNPPVPTLLQCIQQTTRVNH